ncbi:extracellular catalytic domain type 1 short-chain-length polyhydroxyalkanoate depolymerase [Bacillus suaedaesalsae]|uniref:PHB depolymerase family esterase n=1 Tax=Bacillus suaedaesalsae TaxID=2810349 RepID=A0ABS2DLU5_9BACI|nr:PHB depolymerase family esterase [Bacillus suaedaesalsae]MBM6619448.1 PHB depolymerase family esterase [Bacillus suaedaesalsae]
MLKYLFRIFIVTLTFLMTLSSYPQKDTHAASSFTRYSMGGGWYFKVYVPSSYNGNAVPLMVMLHGCTQDADDFAAGTRMNQLAESKNFIVVYPEMNRTYNSYDCWNWFYDYNQHRNGGEAAIIDSMIDYVKSNYNISSKGYAAGISAGGYMTSIMGATYPEHIIAIGIHSGGMYNAADSAVAGTNTMYYGSATNPDSAGYEAAVEMDKSALQRVPTIIFHGSQDGTVYIENAWQAKTQWAQTNDYADDRNNNNSVDANYDVKQTGTTNGYSWEKYVYNDSAGRSLIQLWKVNGLGHAWSGGSSSGSYTDANGPQATNVMWDFFLGH